MPALCSHPLAGMLNLRSWLWLPPNSSPPQEALVHIPLPQPGPCLQSQLPSASPQSASPVSSSRTFQASAFPRPAAQAGAAWGEMIHPLGRSHLQQLPVSAGSLGLLGRLSSSFSFIILFVPQLCNSRESPCGGLNRCIHFLGYSSTKSPHTRQLTTAMHPVTALELKVQNQGVSRVDAFRRLWGGVCSVLLS